MMKHISFFLLLLFNFTLLWAQEEFPTTYKAEYEVVYRLDTTNLENQTTDKMFLFAGSEHGVFLNEARAEAEEKMAEMRKKFGAGVQFSLGKNSSKNPDLNKAIFTDLQSGDTYIINSLTDQEYQYKIENLNLNWEIGEETKEILGYTAQQATTHYAGRDYEAWFTTEIPTPDGPYIFHGLPGLIIELYDTEDHYHFILKAIEQLEEEKVWELPKAKKTTASKLEKLRNKLDKNAMGTSDYTYMMGVTSGISGSVINADGEITTKLKDKEGRDVSGEELKRFYKKALKSRNNPIELE